MCYYSVEREARWWHVQRRGRNGQRGETNRLGRPQAEHQHCLNPNLRINSPASVRSKAGRTTGPMEHTLPDFYAVFELRGANFSAIGIRPIRRKYMDEVC